MTNQIAIVVRLNLDDGRVSGQIYRHLNGTAIPYTVKVQCSSALRVDVYMVWSIVPPACIYTPPKKGQPLNNGQNTRPQCVHYSEIKSDYTHNLHTSSPTGSGLRTEV